MVNLLLIHDAICKKHKLKYWIDYGTLLGAVRHKGFIPWDDDIDVSMPRKDFNKYLEIVQSEIPDSVVFQSKDTDRRFRRNLFRLRDKNSQIERRFNEGEYRGVFIDIFPIDQLKSNRLFLENIIRHYFSIDPFKEEYRDFKRMCFHYILSPLLVFKPLVRHLKEKYIWDDTGDMYSLNWEVNVPYRYKKNYCDELVEIEFEKYRFYAPKDFKSVLTELYGNYMELPPENQRIPRHHTKITFYN